MASYPSFYETTCQFNSETKQGKVLAIATYSNERRICFQIEGEKMGIWLPESVVSMETVREDNKVKLAASDLIEDGEQAAKEDINYFGNFLSNLLDSVNKKATEDIESTLKLISETQDQWNRGLQSTTESVDNAGKQALKLLGSAVDSSGKLVGDLQKTIIDLWDRHWLDRIIKSLKIIDPEQIKINVQKERERYPDFDDSKIAENLIFEKAVFVFIVGGITGSVPLPVASFLTDLLNTTTRFVELIYEISHIYGNDLKSSEEKGEIIAVFGLAFGTNTLTALGIGFLSKNLPAPTGLIDAATNLFMFLTVGYAAREFFALSETKRQQILTDPAEFQKFQGEVGEYVQTLVSDQEFKNRILAQALETSKKLPLQPAN
jgi:uncharacterized protein (DUF697 family)